MSEAVAAKLDAAADIIVERGWWQGAWVGPNGEVCLTQALVMVGEDSKTTGPVAGALRRFLRTFSLVSWNDRRGRIQAEVVAKLREAATAERSA